MSNLWQADYGLRYDFFTIKSTGFGEGFGAFSPRLKITRLFGKRASVYGYIGRFFEPFSFENVSPEAAYVLNLPLQRTEAQFDLKPERDTQLELGGHIPVGSGDLGFRVWQKNANDLIDDTQVGVTLLHQDINYVLGRLSQEALNYVQPLSLNSRAYFTSLTSSRSTAAAKRNCWRHASGSPPALRPPTTSSATPSPAASCSTTGAAAGFLPTPITAAAFRRLSVHSIRRDTAKRRRTRFSTWKTESRYRRRPH